MREMKALARLFLVQKYQNLKKLAQVTLTKEQETLTKEQETRIVQSVSTQASTLALAYLLNSSSLSKMKVEIIITCYF